MMRIALAVLVVALAVAGYVYQQEQPVGAPTHDVATRATVKARDPVAIAPDQRGQVIRYAASDFRLADRAVDEEQHTILARQSWTPPPAPPPPVHVAQAPAAAPVAPPLPFRLVGQFASESGTIYLLEAQGVSHMVRAGDTINGSYRLATVAPDRLEFVYLPLSQVQSLPIVRAQ
jgi:hypothetical protein